MNESTSADETDSTVQTAVSQLPWRKLFISVHQSQINQQKVLSQTETCPHRHDVRFSDDMSRKKGVSVGFFLIKKSEESRTNSFLMLIYQ